MSRRNLRGIHWSLYHTVQWAVLGRPVQSAWGHDLHSVSLGTVWLHSGTLHRRLLGVLRRIILLPSWLYKCYLHDMPGRKLLSYCERVS